MNEMQQIQALLMDSAFWQDGNYRSNNMQLSGGISIEVAESAGDYEWKATWPDGTETKSDRTFPSWQEAKGDLRHSLTKRLDALADAAMSPATVSFW
jgi:hypothetical protein